MAYTGVTNCINVTHRGVCVTLIRLTWVRVSEGWYVAAPRGKTIHVQDDVHQRLADRGAFGDSYNDIIKRLLDATERTPPVVIGDNDGQEEGSTGD
jgi:predicted CopG family antitoxin